jgi:GntR family transcriptional regulator
VPARTGIAAQATALKELEQVPLAARARAAILEAILEQQFEGRLPSEDVLAEMLNVSRTTVRAALQDLERDGLLKRRRAIGTRINQHVGASTLALQRLVGFDYLLREKGHDVRVDITWERRDVQPKVLPLPWKDTQECCVIEKEYFASNELAIYLRDYIPWKNFKSTDFKEPIPASVFEFSKQYCEQPIENAVVELVPRANSDTDVTRLELDAGEPFLRLHETHYSEHGEIIGWSFVDLNDRFVRLEVFRGQ